VKVPLHGLSRLRDAMRILTPFKSVPDPYEGATSLEAAAGTKRVINPFDEIAIEEALRMMERGDAAEVVAVTIGAEGVEGEVRAALAMGVGRAIRIDDGRLLDSFAVARILRAVVDREKPDMVLMGKQAVDDDSNQAGQMLAGLLGWPQATFVSRVVFEGGGEGARSAICTRETDAGLETIRAQLPAVITCDLRLNEPRYVSLPGLMKARAKPIEVLTREDLGVAGVASMTTVVRSGAAPARPAGAMVASVAELVTRLREEAGVL
jgi:electron transfer flavoprotein beta subunit